MTTDNASKATDYKNKMEDARIQLRLLESAKIKSITVRSFDNDSCTFSERVIEVIPRGKVKGVLVQNYQEQIKHWEEKIAAL